METRSKKIKIKEKVKVKKKERQSNGTSLQKEKENIESHNQIDGYRENRVCANMYYAQKNESDI